MNRKEIEAQWNKMKGPIKQHWSKFTDHDIAQINGHYDQLIARFQAVYGCSKAKAEQEIQNWRGDRTSQPPAPHAQNDQFPHQAPKGQNAPKNQQKSMMNAPSDPFSRQPQKGQNPQKKEPPRMWSEETESQQLSKEDTDPVYPFEPPQQNPSKQIKKKKNKPH